MTKNKVTREQWLQGALDFILEHGVVGMTPDRLAKSLGTSRSSYYWHFGTQGEFRKQAVDYWIQRYTYGVAEQLLAVEGRPEGRIELLFDLIHETGITKYEGAVHALAYGDDSLVEMIQETYRFRQQFLKTTLEEIGFSENRLNALSRMLMAFLTWETEMGYSRTRQMGEEHRQLVFDMLEAAGSSNST